MADPPLSEFERIARFFAPLAAPGALGLVDDVALIDGPPGEQYVLQTDAIVEGVDFPPGTASDLVAQKLLRVNLSDLAAKGAAPVGYLLVTALPRSLGEDWLAGFAAGLAKDQATYGIGLLGGDMSAIDGPISLTLAAIGRVAAGRAVLRSGARPGDVVYVSGTLGDAALGLAVLQGRLALPDATQREFLIDRYHLPQPRLELGQRLVGIAHAMLDVSDGLVADLGHLCAASGVAAVVETAKLPLSAAAQPAVRSERQWLMAALGGGDDYELLFAAPAGAAAEIATLAQETGVAVTAIGRIESGSGVRVLAADGAPLAVPSAGYHHF
ncbi:MAG TPA: thiamine-phosphate kinase [Stellaceae bacterium]|nr:thiamine-phosphate kinase [Stellaceae bacterium]